MFDGPDYPKSLEENVFDRWLEKGREHKVGFKYLLIIWDEFEAAYQAVYSEQKETMKAYQDYGDAVSNESLVAMYDLYSESRIQRTE